MALREDFEGFGLWLFRWRSYLPILTIVLVLMALRHFHYPAGMHWLDEIWEFLCFGISLTGLGVRVLTVGSAPKGTSGRNVRSQVADSLNESGMYSIMRHPLYFGNFLSGLGVALFPRSWWMGFLYLLVFWLYYERIMFAEEEFLRRKFGEAYLAWAEHTPAFFPNFTQWTPPQLSFSIRWSIKREYASVFLLIVVFTLMEVAGDAFATHRLIFDGIWVAIFATSAVSYALIRFLSKKTSLLSVKGR